MTGVLLAALAAAGSAVYKVRVILVIVSNNYRAYSIYIILKYLQIEISDLVKKNTCFFR